jgi:hypothetical protein
MSAAANLARRVPCIADAGLELKPFCAPLCTRCVAAGIRSSDGLPDMGVIQSVILLTGT